MEGGGVREGGGYGVMEGGKQWWALTYRHLAFTVHARLHTWAVGGCTCGGDCAHAACRAGGMVATLPMATWPLQYSVKGRRGGKRYDPPAYADSDDGKHCHRLDDVGHCHVVACTRFVVLAFAVVVVGSP